MYNVAAQIGVAQKRKIVAVASGTIFSKQFGINPYNT